MSKTIEILSTKDYDMFYLMEGNRVVNEKHVLKLMESMTEENCMSPIQVNENMEIIDGQHRFNALMRLKLPIYYYIVKGADLSTVQKLNTRTKNWNNDDFLNSWIEKGLPEYRRYKEFYDTYKFPHKINLLLLTQSSSYAHDDQAVFENGKFQIKDIHYACDMANKLTQMAEYYKGYKRRSFVEAMVKAMNTKGFDYKRWMDKMKYTSTRLVDCPNEKMYLELIEEIYNFKNRADQRLVLRAV